MTAVVLRIAHYLLVGASFCAAGALAAQPLSSAASAATTKRSEKGSLPSKKKIEVPVQWDRLDPGTVERASKSGAPKAPSFPAERR